MYKCSKCKKIFKYFKTENGVCPHCSETDIYEIGTCEDCGKTEALEDFDYGRLFNGMCVDCFKKSVTNSEIRDFIKWYYTVEELFDVRSEIVADVFDLNDLEMTKPEHKVLVKTLFDYLVDTILSPKHIPLKEELQVIKNARMWAFDDMDIFYDEWYYVKRENNETV
jgi:hypothetical protein|nr:MAG TPA: dehydrogenase accessory protein [Caudoviricetes sp.]